MLNVAFATIAWPMVDVMLLMVVVVLLVAKMLTFPSKFILSLYSLLFFLTTVLPVCLWAVNVSSSHS